MSDPAPLLVAEAEEDQVRSFLRARPGWLAEHPELYHLLAPPARVHGERLADHMAAMIAAGRARAAALAERADLVLAAGRAGAALAARVQPAVLALIGSADPADCVAHVLPGVLAVDAAALCIEDHHPGAHPLPAGTVARLLGGRDVLFRDDPPDAALLHAEAARLALVDALVRVPWNGPPSLLALASRDAGALDPRQGTGALAFLGRAIGAALDRCA